MHIKVNTYLVMLKKVFFITLFAIISTMALAQPALRTSTYLRSACGGKKHLLPVFALKTNILYDALTNINLGFEVRLGNYLTLDVPVNYNPWVFTD
ncbi:MAG: DUF3575 domain-containing protein, partial [Prevotellaceae bacterium]|nr:DUF3575 domain-containing protein [Prevotellaceae bacterium]